MTGPHLSFCKSVTDLTMPPLRHDYEEPAYKRGPHYVTHSRDRHEPQNPSEYVSYLLRPQAC